jgi:starvation-inducible DNA-binding protein
MADRCSIRPPLPGGDVAERVVAAQGLAALSTIYYKAIEASGTAGDPVTSDLFTGLAAGIDKHLWFIEAHLSY